MRVHVRRQSQHLVRVEPEELAALRKHATGLDDQAWAQLIYPYVTPLIAPLEYRRLSLLLRALPETHRGHVLEAGTGFGVLLPALAGSVRAVEAIDIRVGLATAANHLVRARGLENTHVSAQDLTALAFADESFDAVLTASVLEHLANEPLERALAEIRRVLRPGGVLCCCSPSENSLYRALRVVFGKTKPADHHQTARTIAAAVTRHFTSVAVRNIPRFGNELALFQIAVARA